MPRITIKTLSGTYSEDLDRINEAIIGRQTRNHRNFLGAECDTNGIELAGNNNQLKKWGISKINEEDGGGSKYGGSLKDVLTYHKALEKRNNMVPEFEKLSGGEVGRVPVSSYATAPGGVKKKFFPAQGVAIAGDKATARDDYTKEDNVSKRLDGGNSYVSFQNKLDSAQDDDHKERLTKFLANNSAHSKASTVRINQVRRVSIYGNFSGIGDWDHGYNTTLERFILNAGSSVSDPTKSDKDHRPTEAELVSCIHQIIKIHEYLYVNKIVHGDMHMGNIKVLRNKNGVVLKAFDFGLSKLRNTRYDRADLQYLINKKSVKHIFETVLRNNIRSSNDPSMLKHYPLHKIMALLYSINGGGVGIVRNDYIDNIISVHGSQLLQNLLDIRSRNYASEIIPGIISGMFSLFSNQLVHAIYSHRIYYND